MLFVSICLQYIMFSFFVWSWYMHRTHTSQFVFYPLSFLLPLLPSYFLCLTTLNSNVKVQYKPFVGFGIFVLLKPRMGNGTKCSLHRSKTFKERIVDNAVWMHLTKPTFCLYQSYTQLHNPNIYFWMKIYSSALLTYHLKNT